MKEKLKDFFGNDEKHKELRKSLASCMVILIALIFATIAWFASSRTPSVNGISLGAIAVGDIEISVSRDNWNNIAKACTTGDEDKRNDSAEGTGDSETTGSETTIPMNMPAFVNIYNSEGNSIETADSEIMAPGTYGTYTFYVKKSSTGQGKCTINISQIIKKADESGATESTMDKEIESLFSGHILLFQARTKTDNKYEYSNLITDSKGISVELEGTEPTEVTLYWVWPYEYEDMVNGNSGVNTFYSDENKSKQLFPDVKKIGSITDITDLNADAIAAKPMEGYYLAMNQVFEWNRYKETYSTFDGSDDITKTEMMSDWYDYADTLIGSYVKSMYIHIKVSGGN